MFYHQLRKVGEQDVPKWLRPAHSQILPPAWAQVRDNGNSEVDWLIAGYDNGSKTDITVLQAGNGGVAVCAKALPDSEPVFGGCRLKTGRFQAFYYAPDGASVMKKGRASMHKNGVLNVLEGCDGEFDMKPELADSDM